MDATTGQLAIGNIGVEWLAPTAALLTIAGAILWAFKVTFLHQAIFFATIIGWSVVMFSYLHDRMHVKNFWMERNLILRAWFRRSRQLHDIHHRMMNDGGLMDKNFGIGFFCSIGYSARCLSGRLLSTTTAMLLPGRNSGMWKLRQRGEANA